MDDDKKGLDIEGIVKRLKLEYPPTDAPLPHDMLALLEALAATGQK